MSFFQKWLAWNRSQGGGVLAQLIQEQELARIRRKEQWALSIKLLQTVVAIYYKLNPENIVSGNRNGWNPGPYCRAYDNNGNMIYEINREADRPNFYRLEFAWENNRTEFASDTKYFIGKSHQHDYLAALYELTRDGAAISPQTRKTLNALCKLKTAPVPAKSDAWPAHAMDVFQYLDKVLAQYQSNITARQIDKFRAQNNARYNRMYRCH